MENASVIANPGEKNGDLRAMSCFSSTRCFGVGAYGGSGGTGNTLVESSNKGVWSVVSSPNHGGGKFDKLEGVLCISLEYCVATGEYLNTESGEKGAILAEEWEGTKWNLMSPIENPGKQKNGKLRSVVCVEVASCRAVGNWGTEIGIGVPGSETWNGTEWKATQLPMPGAAEFGELFGISCATANSCLGVGIWREAITEKEVILTDYWNGAEWTYAVPPRPTGATRSEFEGVSCTAVEECIAVGNYTNSGGTRVTLGERWKNKEWTILSTPNPSGAKSSSFKSISCTASEVCNAVGYYSTSTNIQKPMAAIYK